jgi:dihydroflavonol-4-reductase
MFRQMRKAGIIGGFEFIGSYITLKFLSENYRVKVPVSKLKNGEKVLNIPGLSANKYLEEFRGDLNELSEIRKFVRDCDVIIHCGSPFRVNNLNDDAQLFVPEVRGTGSLLKILDEFPNIQKLFFISPPADLNSNAFPYKVQVKKEFNNSKSVTKNKLNLKFEKAVFHAKRVQENALRVLMEKRFEVIFVAPAEVSGNTLVSNSNSTSAGLKYLFKNGVNHDPVFKRILQQNKLQTLVNAEDVAEEVFFKVSSVEKMESGISTVVWQKSNRQSFPQIQQIQI